MIIEPTLVFEWLEPVRIAVVCQNGEPASGREWRDYIALLRHLTRFEHGVLLYTERHLDRAQQSEIAEVTRSELPHRVAVLSPSTAVRFVASMFTLTNRNIRFFQPLQLESALLHLDCQGPAREAVTRSYEQLRRLVLPKDVSSRAAGA